MHSSLLEECIHYTPIFAITCKNARPSKLSRQRKSCLRPSARDSTYLVVLNATCSTGAPLYVPYALLLLDPVLSHLRPQQQVQGAHCFCRPTCKESGANITGRGAAGASRVHQHRRMKIYQPNLPTLNAFGFHLVVIGTWKHLMVHSGPKSCKPISLRMGQRKALAFSGGRAPHLCRTHAVSNA
jgi:hypothetical protein